MNYENTLLASTDIHRQPLAPSQIGLLQKLHVMFERCRERIQDLFQAPQEVGKGKHFVLSRQRAACQRSPLMLVTLHPLKQTKETR